MTFSELTGQPTPLEFRVLAPTIASPVIGTIETIPSSVALSEPPPIVTPTLEASTTATEAVVAPLPIEIVTVVAPTEIASEPPGQATVLAFESQPTNPPTESIEQTQTASPTLPAIEGPLESALEGSTA